MDTAAREQYVFHHLTLIDMERARASLGHLREVKNRHIQEALFRDAVVCYAKPFSRNRSLGGKRELRMEESFVPSALEAAHKEVLTLRDKLIAHVDLDEQAPKVSIFEIDGKKKVVFGVKGYERLFTSHLVDPLDSLAAKAHAHCIAKLGALESAA